ncbi:hypothetical protein N0V93_007862 [Gnomoniopsis smithogilvyi]|uniref:DUF6594 domain-containing protein n=1 Tax=Gnomoniopsis smithogilvyi TaxID=1191159 RepID=A0A9W9CU72_9PEZI|nr:hypothetical protein N0V93_007862 [Gnomoniopsis smithogilvyi]
MSPTYTAPAIETIHQGEKLFTADSHHRDIFSALSFDGPRERARPSSSRSQPYGKKHRSGSPQVHPSLKASPVPADDSRRASGVPMPRPQLRRNASVDFSILSDPNTGLAGWHGLGGGPGDGGKQARETKRARLSLSPRRPKTLRSLSDHELDAQQDNAQQVKSSGSIPSGEEGIWHEQQDKATQGVGSSHVPSRDTPADALGYLEGHSVSRASEYLAITGGERRSSWSGRIGSLRSPTNSSASPPSSRTSTPSSVASSHTTVDSDISTIGQEVDGQETPIGPTSENPLTAQNNRRSADPDRYGTPEMPRGSAKLPHIPTIDLTPRVPSQSHPKHLPRAEKLPKSGYELLASSISSSAMPTTTRNRVSTFLETAPSARQGTVSQRRHSSASASFFNRAASMVPPPDEELTIKPIYRRFEALNHRLLLHLQDELSELEEQLHRLDTTDTQTRRLQSSILPASRRAEFLVGGELQSHKTEILSKIAFKLGQYNHALSSFTSTRDLPAPALSAVTEYRDYLATYRPISDVETRFLDSTEDLITLEAPAAAAAPSSSTSTRPDNSDARRTPAGDYLQSLHLPANDDELPIVTPIPGTMHGNSWLVRHNRLPGSRGSSATSSSPRFARPFPGALEPFASPRLPPSPLRQQHRPAAAVVTEDKALSAEKSSPAPSAHVMLHLALALGMAFVVPVLVFSIIPGFVARMIVVLLVGLSVGGSVAQVVDVKQVAESKGDFVYSGAVYAGLMAMVAGIMA